MLFLMACLFQVPLLAQEKNLDAGQADAESLRLYNEKKWTELFRYGREKLDAGIDFPLLHMRVGYAAFVLGNYSESIRQYQAVYDADNSNAIALYYLYLGNLYLTNTSSSRFYAGLLSADTKAAEGIRPNALSQLDLEYSYKSPSIAARGNAGYARVGASIQLGYRFELQQSVAFYSQTISEPQLTAVNNNNNISISQKEYYAKLFYAAQGNLGLIAGFHYLNTPFNNFIYHNYIGFGGIRFATPYVQLQALLQAGQIRDSAYQQVDAELTAYPLGNTKLYSISRAGIGKEFAFTQVLGIEPLRNVWLEANATFGTYRKMLGNDALYVYDDIDTKKLRAGAGLYLLAGKKLMLKLNYTFEQKARYGTLQNTYHQNAITGGISCSF